MDHKLSVLTCKTAYDFGFFRGNATGRIVPTDRDYQWIAEMTDGRIQCTDPEDAVDFAKGMQDGSTEVE